MTEQQGIRALDHDAVARLYDALHLAHAAAQHAYMTTDDPGPESYNRGRRDGLDEALTILDEFMDAPA